jgi:hypothetical protein
VLIIGHDAAGHRTCYSLVALLNAIQVRLGQLHLRTGVPHLNTLGNSVVRSGCLGYLPRQRNDSYQYSGVQRTDSPKSPTDIVDSKWARALADAHAAQYPIQIEGRTSKRQVG